MYTIKEVAAEVGESEHTIRYYCKEGLFPFVVREDGLGPLRAPVRFQRQSSGFLEGLRAVGLCLLAVPVLAFLSDAVPVFPVGATAVLNARLIEMPSNPVVVPTFLS